MELNIKRELNNKDNKNILESELIHELGFPIPSVSTTKNPVLSSFIKGSFNNTRPLVQAFIVFPT